MSAGRFALVLLFGTAVGVTGCEGGGDWIAAAANPRPDAGPNSDPQPIAQAGCNRGD
jgi:hypothetical protein